ncbi:hypothetical protein DH2020_032461 [Rehmannia glutinosa]|uniref:Uncharacterized protein n=1 Tax=Rehmannia glutinosa TaxID=99300 RepID=A0ABR0VIW7_REHGL
MSCVKANTTQSFQNGPTSKDSEGPRPLKVRKKLFDLQLPADEYIDFQEGHNLQEYKESDPNSGPENSMKLLHGASASVSRLRGSIGLADLNEPIQVEDEMAPSSVDFLGHTENVETKGIDQHAKPNGGYLGVTGETVHVRDGFLINPSRESKDNTRGQLSRTCEAGSTRGNLSSSTQSPQPDKLRLPSQGMYPSGYNREDMWRDVLRHSLESSNRNRDHSNNSHFEPIPSPSPGSYPFVSSSSFATSWAHSVSSWAKPTSSFAQKSTSNGFYHASASGSSKDVQLHLPSTGLDYLNCSRGDNLASDRSTNHGFGIFPKGSCHAGLKPAIDINLNEVLSKSLQDEIAVPQDLNMTYGKSKPDDHLSALPWLKPKPIHVNCEITKKEEISETRTVKKILGVPIFERCVPENEPSPLASTSASIDCHPEGKIVSNERKNGFIDINVACEPDEQIAEEEPTVEKEKPKTGVSIRDHHVIDLNSCISDCEEDPPAYEIKTASVKITLEIDLEVPVFLESEDDSTLSKENIQDDVHSRSLQNKNEQIQDEVLRNAAETIFAISSSCPKINSDKASLSEALIWFVDAVSSHANELENPSRKESRAKEMDDFEAMTLQIAETKEEDYMPKPFILEIPKMDDDTSANALPTRSRRGQTRRGRQRRDFQRDILPGLTTLSRHEVTEDLQTFGGLMRATGHSWSSGLMRRNGGGRGRRRAVVVENVPSAIASQICTPLMPLEDRSLTGWGKTTRRPRRQRCPAGNIPTIAIT